MDHNATLHQLHLALTQARHNEISIQTLCQRWREQEALLSALPARYTAVMEDLLGRLEAGSLFTEESCSFSQQDLYAGLQTWIDKARSCLISV